MDQDSVLAMVNIAFCFTLVPMLKASHKPPLASSLTTGGLLLVAAVTVATLHLWLAAITQGLVGLQWLWLAKQQASRSTDLA